MPRFNENNFDEKIRIIDEINGDMSQIMVDIETLHRFFNHFSGDVIKDELYDEINHKLGEFATWLGGLVNTK